jgi:hypothetical protein
MTRFVFTKAPEDQPVPGAGEWNMITNVHDPKSPREPCIGCPICGCHARLNHTIDAKGIVTPSLVCPHKGCTFHEWGELEGWAP